MVNRYIDSILYQAVKKLGNNTYKLAKAAEAGLEGTKNQNDLWVESIYIDSIIDTIYSIIEVKNNLYYRTIGITDDDLNYLLSLLEGLAGINTYPIVALYPFSNTPVFIGVGGQGTPGVDGADAYNAIAYASNTSGADFTLTPDINTKCIAFKTSNTPIPLTVDSFTGLWVTFVGNNGTNGADGHSSYLYIRYASDTSGTGFTTVPSPSLKYVASLVSSTDLGAPSVGAFAGLWVKYIGDNGATGATGTNGTNGNTILYGSGAPNNSLGVNGDTYLDTLNWYIYAPKAAGAWPVGVSLIVVGPPGADGSNGTNGTNGIDGTSVYIYQAWADDITGGVGFTTIFDSSKDYTAIITSTIPISPLTSADFTGFWVKYKGNGDRWTTSSTTSLTIATGTQILTVEKELAYSVGQSIVIADVADYSKRMEGYVVSYNSLTGSLVASISNIFSTGTFAVWAVSLQALSVSPPTTYSGPSPSTIVVNDLPSGTAITGFTYDTLFGHIYAPYINPTFSSFIMSGQATTIEVGTTISGTKTFTWGTTSSGNITTNTIAIKDVTGASTLISGTANDGTEAVAVGSVTKTTAVGNTWRIEGTNTNAVVFSRDFIINWQWRRYEGTNASATLSSAQIVALANNSLSNTIAGTFALAAGDYKYFVWDDSLGDPTAVTGFVDISTGFAVAMADSTDNAAYSNVGNGWSYALVSCTINTVTSNKRVYRTKNTLAGTISIRVS